MSRWLYEYDTGNKYGPASDRHWEEFQSSLKRGCPFFLYPVYGIELRMVVKDNAPLHLLQTQKAPG